MLCCCSIGLVFGSESAGFCLLGKSNQATDAGRGTGMTLIRAKIDLGFKFSQRLHERLLQSLFAVIIPVSGGFSSAIGVVLLGKVTYATQ